jgi:small subunit ribosomal protein S10
VKLKIRFKSFEASLLRRGCAQVEDLARSTGLTVCARAGLPTRTSDVTVLRSPHVHKKSREQFALRTHKAVLLLEATHGAGYALLSGLKTLRLLGVQVHVTLACPGFVRA